jgi:hypothetical protein
MRSVVTIVAMVGLLAACAGSAPDPAEPGPAANPSEAIAACLQEKGWDATAHPDNSVSGEVPIEQRDQYLADEEDCLDQVQPDQPRPPMSEQQAEAYFDGLLEVADCVRGLGYEVAEPPSRQAAVEALQQPIINLGWDPYEQPVRGSSTEEEIDGVYRACPQPPWPS